MTAREDGLITLGLHKLAVRSMGKPLLAAAYALTSSEAIYTVLPSSPWTGHHSLPSCVSGFPTTRNAVHGSATSTTTAFREGAARSEPGDRETSNVSPTEEALAGKSASASHDKPWPSAIA